MSFEEFKPVRRNLLCTHDFYDYGATVIPGVVRKCWKCEAVRVDKIALRRAENFINHIKESK